MSPRDIYLATIREWDRAQRTDAHRAVLSELGNGLRNAVNDLLRQEAGMRAWQPFRSAPVNEVIDIWLMQMEDEGFRYRGKLIDPRAPYVLESEEGLFPPAENGCWPTHWRTPSDDDWCPVLQPARSGIAA